MKATDVGVTAAVATTMDATERAPMATAMEAVKSAAAMNATPIVRAQNVHGVKAPEGRFHCAAAMWQFQGVSSRGG